MIFPNVNALVVQEGRVRRIRKDEEVIWELPGNEPQNIYALATNNYWISKTGGKSGTDANWISSDKIPAVEGAVIDFYLYHHSSVGNVVAYDAAGKAIGYAQINTTNKYTTPAGTAYITITGCTEQYSAAGFARQYATMTFPEVATPPRYYEDGLILWCDGIDNTGNGHSDAVTTWKDLSGNGNDIFNTMYSDSKAPYPTVRGEWKKNGIWVKNKSQQFLLTPNQFDLGADYTLEIMVTPVTYQYQTIGFRKGARFKLRVSGENWWTRLSETDATGQMNLSPGKPTPPIGVPVTLSITRRYNGTNTEHRLFQDGVYIGRSAPSGDYRSGETSDILIGTETTDLTVHSVRLYNRALSDEEVAYNYEYDRLRFITKEG